MSGKLGPRREGDLSLGLKIEVIMLKSLEGGGIAGDVEGPLPLKPNTASGLTGDVKVPLDIVRRLGRDTSLISAMGNGAAAAVEPDGRI